jgi:hypothetical protein
MKLIDPKNYITGMPDFASAVSSLCPDAVFSVMGLYGPVVWQTPEIAPVTDEEIEAETIRLQQQYLANDYQRNRALEYPPITDYLDAVVKGDLEQQQAYIDACLAVKAKYPKPEEA